MFHRLRNISRRQTAQQPDLNTKHFFHQKQYSILGYLLSASSPSNSYLDVRYSVTSKTNALAAGVTVSQFATSSGHLLPVYKIPYLVASTLKTISAHFGSSNFCSKRA